MHKQDDMHLSNDSSHRRFMFPLSTLFAELDDCSPMINQFPLCYSVLLLNQVEISVS